MTRKKEKALPPLPNGRILVDISGDWDEPMGVARATRVQAQHFNLSQIGVTRSQFTRWSKAFAAARRAEFEIQVAQEREQLRRDRVAAKNAKPDRRSNIKLVKATEVPGMNITLPPAVKAAIAAEISASLDQPKRGKKPSLKAKETRPAPRRCRRASTRTDGSARLGRRRRPTRR